MTLIAAAQAEAGWVSLLGTVRAGVQRLPGEAAEAVSAGGVREASEDGITVLVKSLLLLQNIQHGHPLLCCCWLGRVSFSDGLAGGCWLIFTVHVSELLY